MADPLDLDLARGIVLAHAVATPAVRCAVADAGGLHLAEEIVAPHDHPPADNSAMDGYAVRSDDLAAAAEAPVALRLVGTSEAGHPSGTPCAPGETVRIFTGGLIPAGADAVVIQEQVHAPGDGSVRFTAPTWPGANLRRAGEEYHAGDGLLPAGTRLNPPAIGLLASAGRAEVLVHRRPRVALLTCGEELIEAGSLAPGDPRIVDVNQPMLTAWLRGQGAELVRADRLPDDAAAVAAWLRQALDAADLVLTAGGASVGDRDVIAEAWRLAGLQTLFYRVAMKPGKPVRFGSRGRALVFSLPGNPLAALTACEQLVAPALAVAAGGRWRPPMRLRLPLAADWRPGHMPVYFLRAGLGAAVGRPALTVSPRQGSAILREAAGQPLVAELRGPRPHPAGHLVEAAVDPDALAGRTLRLTAPLPPVVAVWGPSKSGKTRLLELLIPRLRAAGLRIGTVKHTHHQPSLDTPATDSHRHAAAGAERVLLLGPDHAALFCHQTDQPHLWPWLESFAGEVDLVLVEGFKQTPLRHIRLEPRQHAEFSLAAEPDDPDSWLLVRPAEAAFESLYPADLLDTLTAALIAVGRP